MEHIINPVYYQDFILSGKPEFTLKSTLTGNEEIFVVRQGRSENIYWVNNRLRQLIGHIYIPQDASENVWIFEQKSKDILVGQAEQIKIFDWFWNAMILCPHEIRPYDRIKVINHTGRCGHCHRELTHPESIPIGIGPDCFKKLGLTHKTLITS
jgi:uncharacterized CHY-type Zn-finger protein